MYIHIKYDIQRANRSETAPAHPANIQDGIPTEAAVFEAVEAALADKGLHYEQVRETQIGDNVTSLDGCIKTLEP
jgi:hypothetical protein